MSSNESRVDRRRRRRRLVVGAPGPVDGRHRLQFAVEHAVRFVRLVERVVDERVGDFAQTAPSGPGGL